MEAGVVHYFGKIIIFISLSVWLVLVVVDPISVNVV